MKCMSTALAQCYSVLNLVMHSKYISERILTDFYAGRPHIPVADLEI